MSATAFLAAPSTGGLYRNVWLYATGVRLRLLASAALLIASQVIKLCVPWLAAQAIDALQRDGADSATRAAGWIVLVLLVYVAVWTLHGPGRMLERTVGVRVREALAAALYARLLRLPLAWHEQRHSGDVQHRVGQASRALADFAQSQFMYLQSGVNFIGPLVALTLLSTSTGTLALAGYVVVGLVIVRFDGALMRLAKRENEAERRYASALLDFLGNISTVIGLRLQGATQRVLAARMRQVFVPVRRNIVLNEARWCAVDLLSVALTWSLVAMYVWQSRSGAAQGGAGVLLGSVFMIHQYAQQAGGVIGSMASNFQNFARTRADFASADSIWLAEARSEAEAPLAADWRRIEVRDLCFEHAKAAGSTDPARGGLRHVSLTLKRGERIALVGPSGSGKSSLMRVLAGLYEAQHGHVLIDGVAQLGLKNLGAITTLIPQEADVFEASVRENIAFDVDGEEGALSAALHVSAFDDVLKTLPMGLETPISERGFNLSGGQRQRLCLARGVFAARAHSLLLLDEPTSALDPITEAKVLKRLGAAFADACIVASVHRMSLLEHFDRVVLVDGGRIVASGTVADLTEREPAFRALVQGGSAPAVSQAVA